MTAATVRVASSDRRRARLLAAITGIALALAVPAVALAHPLGNFTINHYAGIRVEPDRVILDVVVDQAEIPTFQEKLRIDTDGDGQVSDAEAEAERLVRLPGPRREPSAHGRGRHAAARARRSRTRVPARRRGARDHAPDLRLHAQPSTRPSRRRRVTFADGSHPERIGWREIAVQGSGVTVDARGLPSTSVSNRLRRIRRS